MARTCQIADCDQPARWFDRLGVLYVWVCLRHHRMLRP